MAARRYEIIMLKLSVAPDLSNLEEADAGMPVNDVCRKHRISPDA